MNFFTVICLLSPSPWIPLRFCLVVVHCCSFGMQYAFCDCLLVFSMYVCFEILNGKWSHFSYCHSVVFVNEGACLCMLWHRIKPWEMSFKPYHSLCKPKGGEMWRNVKSSKVTKLITTFWETVCSCRCLLLMLLLPTPSLSMSSRISFACEIHMARK